MKVTVSRSGGFAGLTRIWTAEVSGEQEDRFRELVDSCPWDQTGEDEPSPDRYVYAIEAAQRRITLTEHALTEPWRTLVQRTQEADTREQKEGLEESGAD